MSTVNLTVDPAVLTPLVTSVVEQVLARIEEAKAAVGDQLAFTEEQAARLLNLHSHQLRDERRRGRISASRVVGNKVRYLRQNLVDYLARNRSEPTA